MIEKARVEKPSPEKLEEIGIDTWAPWEHGVDEFDWEYNQTEKFYVKEGKAHVITESGQEVEFSAGDLVTFPRGIKCTWRILEPIKKVYRFE